VLISAIDVHSQRGLRKWSIRHVHVRRVQQRASELLHANRTTGADLPGADADWQQQQSNAAKRQSDAKQQQQQQQPNTPESNAVKQQPDADDQHQQHANADCSCVTARSNAAAIGVQSTANACRHRWHSCLSEHVRNNSRSLCLPDAPV
jgi:hypothetical protein